MAFSYLIRLASLTALAWLAYTPPAQAYLDPGTGSIILQGLVATLAAGFAFVRLFWDRIKVRLFGGKSENETADKDRDTH